MKIRFNLFVVLVLLAFLSLAYSLFKGSLLLDLYQLKEVVKGEENGLLHEILFSIRLPRTLSAFVTGGLLALAGALMQLLLRNPLADPYVLGISGGAAVSTLGLLLFGCTGINLVGGAWVGCLVTILLIFTLTKPKNNWDSQRILLTGIALSSGFSALISFIFLCSPDKELRGMMFWLMGDLSYAHFPTLETLILVIGFMISFRFAKEFNILLRGEQEAQTLGVNVFKLKIILFLLSSLLTAAAVTLAGCVGFIGLIVPHMLRLLGLHDQRVLLPAAILLGGTLLTFTDTIARTWFSPQQLPVGIIMALIGIPIFLGLLQRNFLSWRGA